MRLLRSTVLCVYVHMVSTTGKVKFSNFIPLHMTLIDSLLWVMMCFVSQHLACSSRPWRGLMFVLFEMPICLCAIQCDISCSMFGLAGDSMWRKKKRDNSIIFKRLTRKKKHIDQSQSFGLFYTAFCCYLEPTAFCLYSMLVKDCHGYK